MYRNNEFEMTTNSDNNLFVKNNELYIMPTLTTATGGISYSGLFDGSKYSLDGCTATSDVNCTVSSSNSSGTTIPPVMSARISTRNYTNGAIKYGKVEVNAKLPTGDWLWPAIWMLPKDSTYGDWPISGEIDVSLVLSYHVQASIPAVFLLYPSSSLSRTYTYTVKPRFLTRPSLCRSWKRAGTV